MSVLHPIDRCWTEYGYKLSWSTIAAPRERTLSIIDRVATKHGLTITEILGERRTRKVAHARQEAMWEVRKSTGMSLPKIGTIFGRDHTTVLHAVRAHEERRAK